MKQTCSICGKICDNADMMKIQTSRVQLLCWKCYKEGQYQSGHSQAFRAWNEARTQWRRRSK